LSVPTIIGVAFLSFMLMRLVPGDVILAQIGGGDAAGGVADIDPEILARIREDLGLQGTVPEQFGRWIVGIAHGDFGESYLTHNDSLDQFWSRFPVTLQLGLMAVAMSSVLGVTVGVISALFQDGPADYSLRLVAILGLSIPNFFLGVLMVIFLARTVHYVFPVGVNQIWDDPVTNFRQFSIPSVVLAVASAGVIARLTRTSLLEVMRQDYVRTAFSKGLTTRMVVTRHALKNALIPVVTIVGAQLTFIISGSVVVEQIFNLRGVGQLTITSLFQRDYVQLQTNIFLFGLVLVAGNLITDLMYGFLDPRIRYN
jgi:peptide/nickel transport system permease protein